MTAVRPRREGECALTVTAAVATTAVATTTASATAATSTATTAAATAELGNLEQLRRDNLLGVLENLDEVLGAACRGQFDSHRQYRKDRREERSETKERLTALVRSDVRVGGTLGTGSSGTSDTVNVVLDTVRHVVVDLFNAEGQRQSREATTRKERCSARLTT